MCWLRDGTETTAGRSAVPSGMFEAGDHEPQPCARRGIMGYAELVSDSAPFGPFQIH